MLDMGVGSMAAPSLAASSDCADPGETSAPCTAKSHPSKFMYPATAHGHVSGFVASSTSPRRKRSRSASQCCASGTVLAAAADSRRDGWAFAVTHGSRQVRRVFVLLGLDRHLPYD